MAGKRENKGFAALVALQIYGNELARKSSLKIAARKDVSRDLFADSCNSTIITCCKFIATRWTGRLYHFLATVCK